VEGRRLQTLLGVTGSGKTFTLAHAIARLDRPVLVLSHNKTLAAQLYGEFKGFFPENAVEYFVSYYDYYLPEAYIPQTDTYIAKDASINEEIERYRLAATTALNERRDVIVVASVSCIYGLGSPADYEEMCAAVRVGERLERNALLRRLIAIQYERNDAAPEAGQFRVRGDAVDVFVPHREDEFIRVEFWGDEVTALSRRRGLTGEIRDRLERTLLFPCRHFVMPHDRVVAATEAILAEMRGRVRELEAQGKLVEAQRLHQRTTYDVEMMREIGYCTGIENYARHLSARPPGSRPYCLLDFFPEGFLTVVDESHATLPQVRAMFKGDRSRKQTLVDHGFRLPSALDNRPLTFDEFMALAGQMLFVSATPGDYELAHGGTPVEQVVRPTGLPDPEIVVRPLAGQVDDLIAEIRDLAAKDQRCLVTTLTKKSAERLADYLNDLGLRVKYLHSDLDALQRARILRELRLGDFDCLVGINLLREGLDLPEVALVAILDADKEGFLRSTRSLVQVAGRAARNLGGRVILYADKITDSIAALLDLTARRRERQLDHNRAHGIVPRTTTRPIRDDFASAVTARVRHAPLKAGESPAAYGDEGDAAKAELDVAILEQEMLAAAEALEFERAADLRDLIAELRGENRKSEVRSSKSQTKSPGRASPRP
jgi:excinuclease ABC subunit B